ncbi:MAG: helix-turn-helix domain-containing protein [Pseudorhodoplanes sp.]|nr:MAG: helix-turn-helix domain-containing protein [Pseudorhodoplanes sp.]
MRDSDRTVIRALALFREIAEAEFDRLIEGAFLQRFPMHVVLINEGEHADFLHIIVEGVVELFARYEARETTIEILQPVTTFIPAAVVRDDVYLKSARTLAPSRILMIPATNVREMFGRDPVFARAVVDEVALRYRRLVRALKDQKLRTGAERLANWILETDRQQGSRGRVSMPYEKRTLSALLGMTPENLSRTLASLTAHGISGNGREILISDRDALLRCARPDPLIDGPE